MANPFDQFDDMTVAPKKSPLEDAIRAEGLTGPAADVARSIYQQESSSGKNKKTSNIGAVGGMQMLPATFKAYADKGWSIHNDTDNARAAVRYIKDLDKKADGDPKLISAGYYGGPSAINKLKQGIAVSDPKNPSAPNTSQYADQVVARIPKQANPFDQFDAAHPFDQFDNKEPTAPPEPPPRSTLADLGRQVGLTGRATVTGLMGIPNMLGDAAAGGINLGVQGVNALTGSHIPQMTPPSQATQNLMNQAGMPQPENGTERVVQDVASGMVGAGGLAGAANIGAKVIPAAAKSLATLGENVGTQVVSGATGGGSAGATREAGGGPVAQFLAGIVGGAAPFGVKAIFSGTDGATKNAAKLLKAAAANGSPEQWNQARELLTDAQKVGVPLLGPEALPAGSGVQQLAADVAASPASKNKLTDFVKPRAGQIEQAARTTLADVGKPVGAQEAANQAQAAADEVVRKAQEYRTKAAGPGYQEQRAQDVETMDLSDHLAALPGKIQALTDSRASAVQVSGKLYQFVHDNINAANRTIRRNLGLAGDTKAQRNLDVADQAKGGVHAAVNKGMEYAAQIGASEREFYATQDTLAAKNLPAVKSKVSSFLTKLDQDIRAANPDTTEGKILRQYRDELAPNGEPITLPSQLESVYKANRDKMSLGLNPSALDKTTAGVIGKHIGNLDSLIQDISPAIKNARTIYAQLSSELVDPLLKGPVGKIAGRGADAQKEAVVSRVASEFSGKNATPERINLIGDQLSKVDKTAVPNVVRSVLEDALNKAMKPERGRTATAVGINFRDALEGTPQQKANLEAMVRQAAKAQGQNPDTMYQGVRRLMDVLDATGRLMAPAAATKAGTAEAAGKVAADMVLDLHTPGVKGIINTVKDWTRRGTYAKLAEVFTSADPRAMEKLVNLEPTDPKYIQQAASILRAATGTKPTNDDEEQ